MSSAKNVTDANFKAEVLENSKPTIVAVSYTHLTLPTKA